MPSRHVTTLGFDLDGTLIDSTHSLTLAMQRTREAIGLSAGDPAVLAAQIGWGLDTFLQRSCADHPRFDLGVARAHFIEAYDVTLLDGVQPLPGADALLTRLGALEIRSVLVTNKPSRWVPALLEHLGWTAHFAAVLTGDSHPWRKPDPRILQAAFGDTATSVALFVGDNEVDARAAKGAGVGFVQVRQSRGEPLANAPLEGALVVVESPHEFASWLGIGAG